MVLNNKKGFTLMEIIVAMGIFVIVIGSALGIFSITVKSQRESLIRSKVEREAQLIMEVLVRKIRVSIIDYSYYGGTVTNPTDSLSVIDSDRNRVVFSRNSVDKTLTIKTNNLDPVVMNSSDVTVDSLAFYIEPTTNPFSGGNFPLKQPKVTIVLKVGSTNLDSTVSTTLQQTIPQRGGEY